jgi:hypothetical protein
MKNQPLDNPLEPRLPQSPDDFETPDAPTVPEPPRKRPRDGDQVPDEPKIKAGVIAPNIGREAENSDVQERPTTPLKPGVRGAKLGQSYARLSGSDQQKQENIESAVSEGIVGASRRDIEAAELSQDDDFLEQLGFGKPR